MDCSKKVVILLSTYNGKRYISEQIKSLINQTYKEIFILIRDDGSKDLISKELKNWEDAFQTKIKVILGDNQGYKKSFLKMFYDAPEADIYMFCDQDDVWEKDKIQVAVEKLKDIKSPAIYTSNVRYCNQYLQVIGDSHFNDNGDIWKALLYNQAVGCTMAINNELRKQIMKIPFKNINFDYVYSHDCWVYRICVAIGGECVFDETPHILYRQHGNNQIGGSASFFGTWKNRLKKIYNRHIKQKLALELENCYGEFITDETRKDAIYTIAHYKSLKSKLYILKQKNIYTENLVDNLGVVFAILFSIA